MIKKGREGGKGMWRKGRREGGKEGRGKGRKRGSKEGRRKEGWKVGGTEGGRHLDIA